MSIDAFIGLGPIRNSPHKEELISALEELKEAVSKAEENKKENIQVCESNSARFGKRWKAFTDFLPEVLLPVNQIVVNKVKGPLFDGNEKFDIKTFVGEICQGNLELSLELIKIWIQETRRNYPPGIDVKIPRDDLQIIEELHVVEAFLWNVRSILRFNLSMKERRSKQQSLRNSSVEIMRARLGYPVSPDSSDSCSNDENASLSGQCNICFRYCEPPIYDEKQARRVKQKTNEYCYIHTSRANGNRPQETKSGRQRKDNNKTNILQKKFKKVYQNYEMSYPAKRISGRSNLGEIDAVWFWASRQKQHIEFQKRLYKIARRLGGTPVLTDLKWDSSMTKLFRLAAMLAGRFQHMNGVFRREIPPGKPPGALHNSLILLFYENRRPEMISAALENSMPYHFIEMLASWSVFNLIIAAADEC